MTAAHFCAMKLVELGTVAPHLHPLQPGEVARFTNAAARMMDVFQQGCQTMLKLKALRGSEWVKSWT
jgi:hypothetical protein